MVSWPKAGFAKAALFALVILSASAARAGPEEGLFQAAKIMYSSAESQSPELKRSSYENIRVVLDQIVADYPGTHLAVRILLQDTIDGLDVAAIDAAIVETTEADSLQSEGSPNQEDPNLAIVGPTQDQDGVSPISQAEIQKDTMLDPVASPEAVGSRELADFLIDNQTSEITENKLDLSRDMRREIQRRLTLIGYDTKGVDGSLGKNSREAIFEWQAANKFVPTGYLNDSQLFALNLASAEEFATWEEEQASKPKSPRIKRRVKHCKRGLGGILYDCRYLWR